MNIKANENFLFMGFIVLHIFTLLWYYHITQIGLRQLSIYSLVITRVTWSFCEALLLTKLPIMLKIAICLHNILQKISFSRRHVLIFCNIFVRRKFKVLEKIASSLVNIFLELHAKAKIIFLVCPWSMLFTS